MAKEIKAPPALLARNVLEKHLALKEQNSKSNIRCFLHFIFFFVHNKKLFNYSDSRPAISKLLKDTTLIEEKDMAYEVYLVIMA